MPALVGGGVIVASGDASGVCAGAALDAEMPGDVTAAGLSSPDGDGDGDAATGVGGGVTTS